ncbi:SecY-interacting protein [Shewanella sp. SR44-3]|uniref:SecY-interacting protein n=1 Tax=unclassified Shewanella TaxID=196818 RepID=UPI0015F9A7B1|nr:SecY-interacting protein [Shewanella sp. SR44-3]MBB1270561.1 SecY-interacting protein [Shewanella sp. SR44-3]
MSCSSALEKFINSYLNSYQDALSELPRYYPMGVDSPCIMQTFDEQSEDAVYWQPVKREQAGDFDNVATALTMALHQDINQFYGTFFSAPLQFNSPWGEGELLLAWSLDDFEYLQQNIIGHLIMKQKLKQAPTWFIGVLDEGDAMLTVDNETGAVWIEIPGEVPNTELAASIADFIATLTPRITPALKPVQEINEQWQHPGIWQRMKLMWQDLTQRMRK